MDNRKIPRVANGDLVILKGGLVSRVEPVEPPDRVSVETFYPRQGLRLVPSRNRGSASVYVLVVSDTAATSWPTIFASKFSTPRRGRASCRPVRPASRPRQCRWSAYRRRVAVPGGALR